MAKVAIVGAGQAGLLAAHALRLKDYEVTLHSERTPEDFLEKARPTGVAARFDMALEFERELGLEHWGDVAPHGEGVHLHFLPKKGSVLVTLLGRLSKPFSPSTCACRALAGWRSSTSAADRSRSRA